MSYIVATSSLWRRSFLQGSLAGLFEWTNQRERWRRPGLHAPHLQAAHVHPSSPQTDMLTDETPAAALTIRELQLCGGRHSFQICALKTAGRGETQQKRRGRGSDTVIFFIRTNKMITTRGTKQKMDLKGNRLYKIADNETIIDKFSYIFVSRYKYGILQ